MPGIGREERDHGVRINVISPGLIDTDMGARLVNATSPATRSKAPRPIRRSGESASRPTSLDSLVFLAGLAGVHHRQR